MRISDFLCGEEIGELFFAKCPFCGGQMVCTEDKFVCYGCNKSGTLVDFLAEKNNVSRTTASWQLNREDYRDLIKALEMAEEYYMKRLSQNNSYVAKRGIPQSTIQRFGIGWADGTLMQYLHSQGVDDITAQRAGLVRPDGREYFYNRLMFPIKNSKNRTIGFGGRITRTNSNAPKYLNSPENRLFKKKEVLFGIQNINANRPLYIVEGYMDAISLQSKGVNAVAVLGTAVGKGHAYLLRSLGIKDIILSLDADEAGTSNAIKGLGVLSEFFNLGVLCCYNGCKDPDEFINRYGAKEFYELPVMPKNEFLIKMGSDPVDIL